MNENTVTITRREYDELLYIESVYRLMRDLYKDGDTMPSYKREPMIEVILGLRDLKEEKK